MNKAKQKENKAPTPAAYPSQHAATNFACGDNLLNFPNQE